MNILEIGIEKGREEGQIELLKRLVHSGKLSVEEAAATMNMTVAELEKAFEASVRSA